MGQFRSASDQKNAPPQNEHSAAFIARQQPAVFEDMFVELSVWGLKSRRKSSGTALAQPQPLEACGTKREALGKFLGLSGGLLSYSTLTHRHSAKELILWPPSGAPPHTARCGQCGAQTVLGGRWFLSALNLAYPCKWGLIFRVEKLTKKVTVTVEVDTPRKPPYTLSSHQPW